MSPELHVEDGAATATITGWVQLVKGWLPEKHWKFLPAVSIGCGILYALAAKPGSSGMGQRLLAGVILGLTASGLFSAVNAAFKKG